MDDDASKRSHGTHFPGFLLFLVLLVAANELWLRLPRTTAALCWPLMASFFAGLDRTIFGWLPTIPSGPRFWYPAVFGTIVTVPLVVWSPNLRILVVVLAAASVVRLIRLAAETRRLMAQLRAEERKWRR